jgi:hypothetical protein
MHEIDFRNLFAPGKQGVEGKGDHLWLTAQRGDQGGGARTTIAVFIHGDIHQLMQPFV